MSRRLLALNIVLAVVSIALAIGIARTLLVKRPLPGPAAPRAANAPAPAATAEPVSEGPGTLAAIAARSLFNPGRTETAAVAAVAVAKPILHGVVINGTMSRAFLEDPVVKRVAGYSVGDMVGGGKIQKIADDRVVIGRPEGLMEVLLQDPSKPRAAPAPTAVTAPQGQPMLPGQPVLPGQPMLPSQFGPPPVSPPIQGAVPPPQVRRRVPGQAQGQPAQ
jgi:hypothetical protein